MTHREIVVRLAEAYIKAGQSIEADKIIKIADYFMAHTNDSGGYSSGSSWLTAVNNGSVPSMLYSSTLLGSSVCDTANSAKACATNEDINNLVIANEIPAL